MVWNVGGCCIVDVCLGKADCVLRAVEIYGRGWMREFVRVTIVCRVEDSFVLCGLRRELWHVGQHWTRGGLVERVGSGIQLAGDAKVESDKKIDIHDV